MKRILLADMVGKTVKAAAGGYDSAGIAFTDGTYWFAECEHSRQEGTSLNEDARLMPSNYLELGLKTQEQVDAERAESARRQALDDLARKRAELARLKRELGET
jgi:hypothetical protein